MCMCLFIVSRLIDRQDNSVCFLAAQFEGSLGRLTAASVHNPRQIIDVCRNVSPTNEDLTQKNVSKELRRYRQLLMDIEKVQTFVIYFIILLVVIINIMPSPPAQVVIFLKFRPQYFESHATWVLIQHYFSLSICLCCCYCCC